MNREEHLPPPIASDVPPLPPGWHALSCKVLAGSRLAVLGADVDLLSACRSDRKGDTEGKTTRVAAEATARVWAFDGDDLIEAVQFPLLDSFPLIDQFPDGRWLVTTPRLVGHGNARILRADGTEERRIELGDFINHIQIDDEQRIWVGWSDQGVFGNDKWRVPGLKWAPSASGIAAFDEWGNLQCAVPPGIMDCYALNVSADTAWACTYTQFPIWQINHDRQRTWPTDLRGTRALAVSYPHVLAAGGYADEANRAVLLRLDDQGAEVIGEWRLPLGLGDPDEISLFDGREDELHLVRGQRWHRWRVRDFAKLCD